MTFLNLVLEGEWNGLTIYDGVEFSELLMTWIITKMHWGGIPSHSRTMGSKSEVRSVFQDTVIHWSFKKTARAQHLSTNIVNFHEAPWSFCFTIFTFRIISHHAAAGGDVVPKSSSNETRQRFACQVCQVCWGGHGWKSCRTKVQVGKPDRTNANSC